MSKKFYTLRNDAVFRNVFYKHPEIMEIWIKKILRLVGEDIEIKEFKIKNCELTKDRLYIKNKTIDMLVDIGNMIINCELNNNNFPEFIKNRNFIYLISALTHNIHIKDNYGNIKLHIQFNFNFEGKDKQGISVYEYLEKYNHKKYIEFLKIYTINVDKHIDEWYNSSNKEEYFKKYQDILILGMNKEELKNMESEDEYMTLIKDEIFKLNESSDFYQLFTDEEDYQRTLNSAIIAAKEAEEKGEKRGEQRGIIKTTINMLNDGVDKNKISKYTGLSIKEIEKVAL